MAETPDQDELFVEAKLNQPAGGTFTEVKAIIRNRSAFPARSLKGATVRYWFTLDAGVPASSLAVTTNYSECGTTPAKVVPAGGALYYAELSCVGQDIHPGGQSQHRREIQFRVTGAAGWDATNDPSFVGLPATGDPVKTRAITLYDGGVLVWGTEPGGPTPTPPATPTPTPTSGSATCAVTYGSSAWSTGFTASVRLKNTGAAPLTWSLTFDLAPGQQLTQGWSATWSQTGTRVTATGAAWNATLAPGASVDLGFNGSHTGQVPAPTAFAVNGTACVTG